MKSSLVHGSHKELAVGRGLPTLIQTKSAKPGTYYFISISSFKENHPQTLRSRMVKGDVKSREGEELAGAASCSHTVRICRASSVSEMLLELRSVVLPVDRRSRGLDNRKSHILEKGQYENYWGKKRKLVIWVWKWFPVEFENMSQKYEPSEKTVITGGQQGLREHAKLN